MLRRALLPCALGAALAACSGASEPANPAPATADEEAALAKAQDMLEERPAAETDAPEVPAEAQE